ncbi:uroporphyrinogen-III synthase [Aquimarina sp. RZ0]|nr:uroporphyrinogen-III synthase [Aquimarina sp. RZ0]
MPTILSTKKLFTPQKELLLNSGLGLVEYDAIEIELLAVNFSKKIQNAIVTSKNAVKGILHATLGIQHCFCVGEHTRKLLEENGYMVVETASNASVLAEIIVKKYKKDSFVFFCGNKRRDELPLLLRENNIQLEEEIVYKTELKPKKMNRTFEGILFFSPSAVQSYVAANTFGRSIAFCIGNTTASEAEKYAGNIIVATKPTVENVIVQAVKYFDKRI